MRYGADGYAIYWYCLELIAGDLGESKEINFDLKHDAEVIGFNLKIDQLRVEEIIRYMVNINLFEESNGIISCIRLAKYLDKKTTRNETIHKIVDSYTNKLTNSVTELSATNLDCPDLSRLDTDTDTDTEYILLTETKVSETNKSEIKKEEKQRSNTKQKKILTSFPENFEVTLEMCEWAVSEGVPEAMIKKETQKFKDYCLSKDSRYKDWLATWRNWMRNAVLYNYNRTA